MEEIKFRKVILSKGDDGQVFDYRFSLLGQLPPTLEELQRTGFITISTKYQADYSDEMDESEDEPVIALYQSTEVQDWEDSWFDEQYQVIKYDPINGEEIKITVIEEVDNSSKIVETEQRLTKLRQEITKIEKEKLEALEDELLKIERELDSLYSQKGV